MDGSRAGNRQVGIFHRDSVWKRSLCVRSKLTASHRRGIGRNRLKLYTREGGTQGTAGLTSMYCFAAISIHLENPRAEMSHPFLSNRSSGKEFCSMGVICQPLDSQIRYVRIDPVEHWTETIWSLPNSTFYMGLYVHWTIYTEDHMKPRQQLNQRGQDQAVYCVWSPVTKHQSETARHGAWTICSKDIIGTCRKCSCAVQYCMQWKHTRESFQNE